MKLQDAFIAENGNVVGNFTKIGYEMSSNGPFTYSNGVSGTDDTQALSTSKIDAWVATSKVALNDCATGSTWTLEVKAAANGNGAAWNAVIDPSSTCSVLTPRFTDLTRGEAKSGT